MVSQLLPFLTASVLLTLSPGPDIIFVLVQSISNGKKAGFLTSLGLVSGIVVHTALVAFGISAVIKQSDILFFAIKILGAIYLFYLAYKVVKSPSAINIENTGTGILKGSALIRRGFIMNVLNPKVTIFFLAFFPGFLWDPERNTIYQFFTLGFIFMLQAFLIFSLVSILAGKISHYINTHPSAGLIFKWLKFLVFVGIGFLILI